MFFFLKNERERKDVQEEHVSLARYFFSYFFVNSVTKMSSSSAVFGFFLLLRLKFKKKNGALLNAFRVFTRVRVETSAGGFFFRLKEKIKEKRESENRCDDDQRLGADLWLAECK